MNKRIPSNTPIYLNLFFKKRLKQLLWCLLICCFNQVQAQDKAHEIGVRFSGFNNFSLIYKKQKTENRFMRHRLFSISLLFNSDPEADVFARVGYAFGIEKRKKINENFSFFHGFEPFTNISFTNREVARDTSLAPLDNNNALNITLGLGYVLGCRYELSKALSLSIEAVPNLSSTYFFDKDDLNRNFRISFGFNSIFANITLGYKFDSFKLQQGIDDIPKLE